MSNKIPPMLTADATWYRLNRDNNFKTLFDGLKEYLKSKLKVIKIEGVYAYYSCGSDYHHKSMPGWKPIKHFIDYCNSQGYDYFVVKELIEEKLKKEIICECEIVNNIDEIKRARLQRSFGIDFGEPGYGDSQIKYPDN
ncbi:hypothetical protein ACFLYZ_01230 [Thermodesulfobacteriota bacterium]